MLLLPQAKLPLNSRSRHRTVESLCRASNNIIERLHASFFLYLLPEPFQFLSVASYLSAPLLIGASMTIAGLRTWSDTSPGSAISAISVVAISHALGLLSFLLVNPSKPRKFAGY